MKQERWDGKAWDVIWTEDDCTILDPDHETPDAALLRLTGIDAKEVKPDTTIASAETLFCQYGDYATSVAWPGSSTVLRRAEVDEPEGNGHPNEWVQLKPRT